jgi:hypothetical protein
MPRRHTDSPRQVERIHKRIVEVAEKICIWGGGASSLPAQRANKVARCRKEVGLLTPRQNCVHLLTRARGRAMVGRRTPRNDRNLRPCHSGGAVSESHRIPCYPTTQTMRVGTTFLSPIQCTGLCEHSNALTLDLRFAGRGMRRTLADLFKLASRGFWLMGAK